MIQKHVHLKNKNYIPKEIEHPKNGTKNDSEFFLGCPICASQGKKNAFFKFQGYLLDGSDEEHKSSITFRKMTKKSQRCLRILMHCSLLVHHLGLSKLRGNSYV